MTKYALLVKKELNMQIMQNKNDCFKLIVLYETNFYV